MWRWVTNGNEEDSISKPVHCGNGELNDTPHNEDKLSLGDQSIPVIKRAKVCDQDNIVLS